MGPDYVHCLDIELPPVIFGIARAHAMTRQRKIEEKLWEDSEEKLSSDHVVERFFSQHERDSADSARKGHAAPRVKRRSSLPPKRKNRLSRQTGFTAPRKAAKATSAHITSAAVAAFRRRIFSNASPPVTSPAANRSIARRHCPL